MQSRYFGRWHNDAGLDENGNTIADRVVNNIGGGGLCVDALVVLSGEVAVSLDSIDRRIKKRGGNTNYRDKYCRKMQRHWCTKGPGEESSQEKVLKLRQQLADLGVVPVA